MHFQTMHISSSFLLGVFIHSFSKFYRVCALGCIFPRSKEYHSELDRPGPYAQELCPETMVKGTCQDLGSASKGTFL